MTQPRVASRTGMLTDRASTARDLCRLRLSPRLDLYILALLLGLTVAFGRPFSKIGLGSRNLYVTEVALLVIATLSLRRIGVRAAMIRLRTRVPTYVLLGLWVAGAIALARGLGNYGATRVSHDVGIVEYSALVPIAAVVLEGTDDAILLLRAIWVGGLLATLAYASFLLLDFELPVGTAENPTSAIGLAMTAFAAISGLGIAYQRRSLWQLPLVLLALALTVLLGERNVLIALIAVAVAVSLVAPRGRHLAVGAGVAGAVAAAFALAWALTAVGVNQTLALVPEPPSLSSGRFIADDDASSFSGGRVVRDSAVGRLSREVPRGQWLELPSVRGLRPGDHVTIQFWVKPLGGRTFGRVGNTAGSGWGTARWYAPRSGVWQLVRTRLRATRPSERLVLFSDGKVAAVRYDGIELLAGRRGRLSGVTPTAQPVVVAPHSLRQPAPPVQPGGSQPLVVARARRTFSGNDRSGAAANFRWRLAYWNFLLRRTRDEPLIGVGFGRPGNFRWRGVLYDARRGDPKDPNDFAPPHNSYVALLYRTGLAGTVPFVLLVAIALMRAGRCFCRSAPTSDREIIGSSIALFVLAGTLAMFNVVLEGPYMGLLFWIALALLLVVPRIRGHTGVDALPRPQRRAAAEPAD